MDTVRECADEAISDFVRDEIGSPPWPNWAGLQPGDTQDGWNASKADWRRQADMIMDDLERCVRLKIGRNQNEIDRLRMQTLATFSDYLVEKAELAAAEVTLRVAASNLRTVKASLKTFRAR